MMKAVLLLLVTFLAGTARAQRPCNVNLDNGTQITVMEGSFSHPDYCGQSCICEITYPDLESGQAFHSTICGCRWDLDGERYCAEKEDFVFVEGQGLCECKPENNYLECVDWNMTNPPSIMVSDAPSELPTEEPTASPFAAPSPSVAVPPSAGSVFRVWAAFFLVSLASAAVTY